MTLAIAATVLVGLVLVTAGLVLLLAAPRARAVGGALLLLGVCAQFWWVAVAAMVLFKFVVLRQDT